MAAFSASTSGTPRRWDSSARVTLLGSFTASGGGVMARSYLRPARNEDRRLRQCSAVTLERTLCEDCRVLREVVAE